MPVVRPTDSLGNCSIRRPKRRMSVPYLTHPCSRAAGSNLICWDVGERYSNKHACHGVRFSGSRMDSAAGASSCRRVQIFSMTTHICRHHRAGFATAGVKHEALVCSARIVHDLSGLPLFRRGTTSDPQRIQRDSTPRNQFCLRWHAVLGNSLVIGRVPRFY